ncbi:hypothetical protein [Streptomyces nigra]|uniref:hypothetical protein n=1 Tax=Streptomyces nigra TaxID=1827580 RepID=UPI00363D1AC9
MNVVLPNPYSPYADADPLYRHTFLSFGLGAPKPGVLVPTDCERLAVVPDETHPLALDPEQLPAGLCPTCIGAARGDLILSYPAMDCRRCESRTHHNALCAQCRQEAHADWWDASSTWARPFRIVQGKQVLDGAVFPNGQAIVIDDPETGLSSGAPTLAQLLTGYHRAEVLLAEDVVRVGTARAQHAVGLYSETAVELEDARRDLAKAQNELIEEMANHDPRLRCLIVKPDRDKDQYVGWSNICEMPAGVWSRETALEYGFPPSRLDRADKTGTSSHIGDGGWDDKGFVAEQRGWLRRELLGDYAVEYLLGDREAAFALLEPFDSEPADGPSEPVMTDVTSVCTCTVGEPCGCDSMEPDDDQDDEQPTT